MKTVNVHEAKTHLSKILSEVENGEEYIVARAGKAVARLLPFERPTVEPRPGKWSGRVVVHQDFDAEDQRITDMFDGVAR